MEELLLSVEVNQFLSTKYYFVKFLAEVLDNQLQSGKNEKVCKGKERAMVFTSRFLTFALFALCTLVIGLLKIDHTLNYKARTGTGEVIRLGDSAVSFENEVACLTEALNFEVAYHDTYEGIAAVALVILNRTKDPEFPHTICGVVHQNWWQGSYHHCEFSYYCDGKAEIYRDLKWKAELAEFAAAFLTKPPDDFTQGRKYYFAHKYFVEKGLEPPHWLDCEIFGSQTFCQGIPRQASKQKTQVASK